MAKRSLKQSKSLGKDFRSHVQARHSDHQHRPLSRWKARYTLLPAVIAAAAAILYYYIASSRASRSLGDLNKVEQALAFDIVDLPGKGKGLIASRDIEQGELLIKEKPLILVPSSTNESPVQLLKDRLNALTQTRRDEYYSLSYITPGKDHGSLSNDDVTLAIFQTNAISAGDNVGLFPRTARLNHGCSAAFNSVYSWRPQEGHLVVHAIKSIKRGQELLTTYTDTKRPRHDRQAYLTSYYDFTCTCSVCSLPEVESAASDERLTRMSALYQAFATWGQGQIDGIAASRIAKEIWELGDKEGYWSERGRLAADVVHVAAAHSDKEGVLAWAKLSQTWYAIELGNDSAQALEMQALLNNPRSHFVWGARQPQEIDLPDQ